MPDRNARPELSVLLHIQEYYNGRDRVEWGPEMLHEMPQSPEMGLLEISCGSRLGRRLATTYGN